MRKDVLIGSCALIAVTLGGVRAVLNRNKRMGDEENKPTPSPPKKGGNSDCEPLQIPHNTRPVHKKWKRIIEECVSKRVISDELIIETRNSTEIADLLPELGRYLLKESLPNGKIDYSETFMGITIQLNTNGSHDIDISKDISRSPQTDARRETSIITICDWGHDPLVTNALARYCLLVSPLSSLIFRITGVGVKNSNLLEYAYKLPGLKAINPQRYEIATSHTLTPANLGKTNPDPIDLNISVMNLSSASIDVMKEWNIKSLSVLGWDSEQSDQDESNPNVFDIISKYDLDQDKEIDVSIAIYDSITVEFAEAFIERMQNIKIGTFSVSIHVYSDDIPKESGLGRIASAVESQKIPAKETVFSCGDKMGRKDVK